MPDKQEFLEQEFKKFTNFKNLISEFVLSVVDKIKNSSGDTELMEQAEKAHRSKLEEFAGMVFDFATQAKSMGILKDPQLKDLDTLLGEIDNILHDPVSYAERVKSERASEMRAKEPVTNLGPVEIGEVLSKDKLEEQLFELHDKHEAAISSAEKEEVQKEIDRVLNLYRNAKSLEWTKK